MGPQSLIPHHHGMPCLVYTVLSDGTDSLRSPPSMARVLVHHWILSIHPPLQGQAHYLIGQ